MDYKNIKLQENTKLSEKSIEIENKRNNVFRKAVFEVVAIALIIAMFLFENGELIVKDQPLFVLLGNIAVMFILTILYDNNYRIKGKLTGYSSPNFINARRKLSELTSNMSDEDIEKLNCGVKKHIEERYRSDLATKLYKIGISINEFDSKYKLMSRRQLKKSGINFERRVGIKQAKRIKTIKISAEALLCEASFSKNKFDLGKSRKQLDIEHNVRASIMYMLSTMVFTYFTVEVVTSFSIATMGWYLMKITFLAFRGVKSYYDSYLEITQKITKRLENQAKYLEYFIS